MTEPTTPLMQQYNALKKQQPNALLLFRLGDFYELFYDDAILASRIPSNYATQRGTRRGANRASFMRSHLIMPPLENYIAPLIPGRSQDSRPRERLEEPALSRRTQGAGAR